MAANKEYKISETQQTAYDHYRDIIESVLLQPPLLPYTPMIKSITLSAGFKESIINSSIEMLDVYGQYAYGFAKAGGGAANVLVPSFATVTKDGTTAPSEAELYIGFKDVKPAQSLNILIAVEEGSSNPDLPNPDVAWTYLLNNKWESFSISSLFDGTKGLIQSGIISLILPDEDINTNTLLPEGFFWLRASVPFNQSAAVCRILSVHTQAVLAGFEEHGNDPAYPGTNIPANTITKLSPKSAAIKKVSQPLPSVGGKKTEEAQHLYSRISERLRHKMRAINAWDYENMILEAFPDIYKVKVLPHACPLKGTGNSVAQIISRAGRVLILVVPKTYALSSVYKPLVSKARLTAMYEFIRPLVSPFAKITVMNPLFEEVAVSTEIGFRSFVRDKIFYENKLQDDIKRFLSPWAFEDGLEPEFGGIIYKSTVMDFIEDLPYIDYVKSLELIHANTVSGEQAEASSLASVLISSSQHIVTGILFESSDQQLKSDTIAFC